MMWEKLKPAHGDQVSQSRAGCVGYEHGRLTMVVQVIPELHVSVATSRDVKITLHLVQVQAAKDATGIGSRAPQLRRLGPLGPPFA